MNHDKSFIKFIAYLQIIGIILVVFGHSFHEYPDGGAHGTTLPAYRLMYNFRMPLFMFVSGFLMYYTAFQRSGAAPHPGAFAWKKVKRLLLPFVTLTLVTYVPRAAMSAMADEPVQLSVQGALRTLVYTAELPIPFFWFIQASFLLLIVNYAVIYGAVQKRVPLRLVMAGLVVVFALLPLASFGEEEIFGHISAISLGIYFVLGIVYCCYYGALGRVLPLDSPLAAVVSAAAWLLLFYIGEGTWVARLGSVFGIAMCISIAKLLVKHNLTFLDHLIGANYIIFLLSWYCNVASQQVLSHYVSLPWWCYTVLSLLSGIYVPWLFYRFLQSRRGSRLWCSVALLLGQSLKKKG